MRSKNVTSIVLLTTFCILVLNFQFIYIFTEVEYYTQEFAFQNNRFKEDYVKSAKSGSFDLYGRSTYGLSAWAKDGDWISFEFETTPSVIIEVSMVDEAEWNTEPTDGIFTDRIYWGENDKGFGFFFPSHEDKWMIAFRNPTYMPTKVYYTIETTPYIIIRNPSSSTTAYTDSTLEIQWKTNFGTWVDIDLYKGNSFETTLLHHTYNDGYASFHISEEYSEGDDYKIKISDESSNEYDFSEQFSIKHPKIEILYPFQGDTYIPHTTRSIFWTSSGINSKVSIELLLDSTMILLISNETSNNGEFRWTIWQGEDYAQDTYSTYQIQIKDINSQKYIDSSPFFTITKERYMSILSPTQNSSFSTGNYLNISWKTDSTIYRVNIKIMQENSIRENITDVKNNGFYQWKIPKDFKKGTNYYIRIEAPDNSVNATSELFTIEYIPQLKVSGYNIPLFSIIIGLFLGIFSFKCKKR